jgi:hypothetical protein
VVEEERSTQSEVLYSGSVLLPTYTVAAGGAKDGRYFYWERHIYLRPTAEKGGQVKEFGWRLEYYGSSCHNITLFLAAHALLRTPSR